MNFLIEAGFVFDLKSDTYTRNCLSIPANMLIVLNESMKDQIVFLADEHFQFSMDPAMVGHDEHIIVTNGRISYEFFVIAGYDNQIFADFVEAYQNIKKMSEN